MPTRVAVLSASYAESNGDLKNVEGGYEVNPAHFFAPRWPPAKYPELDADPAPDKFVFELIPIHKRTAYRQVRDAVKSGRYDCFFNLCDAAKEEDRAGVEVLHALEEFRVPYTGATSRHYEPTKDDMKKIVHYHGIRTARGCIVGDPDDIERKCRRLRFPVIVKHVSGYSSVGMTKDSKCADMPALIDAATSFIARYERVLIEEFIEGEEATVLACADPSSPGGIKVFPPVKMRFPPGEDFKHFDLKWNTFDDMAWYPMDASDPAYEKTMEIGALAFKHIMDGVGYGRSDVRIDAATGEPVFLELNPNCGIMYPYGDEGSADWILRLAGPSGQGHRDFIELQVTTAIERAKRNQPMYECLLDDETNAYVLEATRNIPRGTIVFEDEGRPTRLFTRDYVLSHWSAKDQKTFYENAWPMGCDQHVYAVWDKQPDAWRPIAHSCEPNLRFVGGRSLNVEALRDISRGERLTMDYQTFMDSSMPPFQCRCGATNCRRQIFLDQTPGFLHGTEQGKQIASFHRHSPVTFVTSDESAATTSSGTRSPDRIAMSAKVVAPTF